MMLENDIKQILTEYSDGFDYSKKETVIILAAGHGKRIKSTTSKMLHKIWEVPTVERVYNACNNALENANIIIVVGIKAVDVIKTVGRKKSLIYAYQEEQNGTGHAVQVALEGIDTSKYEGTVYVFPGDMGLIDADTVKSLRDEFYKSQSDMMVLTGLYEGETENNYYGRIVRVKDKDSKGNKSGKDKGNVLEIIEYKDILNLNEKKPYKIKNKKKEYAYSKKELLETREYNSGVFGFKFKELAEHILKIESNNVQNEIYLTDLIYLFNKHGLKVSAMSPKEQYVVMGFNNKSVLKEMDVIARKNIYEKLKDVVSIEDPEDFFINESVVEEIIQMDKAGVPLDIKIGKGVYIGNGVKFNHNITLGKNIYLDGKVCFGKNIVVGENTRFTCYQGQSIEISDNCEILWGNAIKGNVKIGENCRLESGVKITGSDEFPVVVGKNVIIKGITYILGCEIDDNIFIEHSILMKNKIKKPADTGSEIFKVRFHLPEAEGTEAITGLK